MDGGNARPIDGAITAAAEDGCAFILDECDLGGGKRSGAHLICGAERQARSPYCRHHHALCHITGGSAGEGRRLRETEALAAAVGGRRGRPARVPSDRFLRRLERTVRDFSRPNCSCIVPKEKT